MIIPGVASSLLNIENSFYYCGMEISKNNFDIKEFASVCNIINELKKQMSFENAKNLSIAKNKTEIISATPLTEEQDVIISAFKNKYFISIYNKKSKEIEPLTKDILALFTDDLFISASYQMDVTAKRFEKGIIRSGSTLTDTLELLTFDNYKTNIEKLSNCFYHTYELEFINGYKDYILTDEQLKCSLEER